MTEPSVLDLATDIEALGATVEAVVTTLTTECIHGTPTEPDRCLVANYLTKLGYADVEVWKDTNNRLRISAGDDEILAPDQIVMLVDAFDAGQYPGLQAR